MKSKLVVTFAAWFSFFAIVTSFLAQSLGLMHFIADGLKEHRGGKFRSIVQDLFDRIAEQQERQRKEINNVKERVARLEGRLESTGARP